MAGLFQAWKQSFFCFFSLSVFEVVFAIGFVFFSGLKGKNEYEVALFIFEAIYCRYGTPGECIIHDRGTDFCNKVQDILHSSWGTDIRVIESNRPQGNGMAEAAVKQFKRKFKSGILQVSDAGSGNIFFLFFFSSPWVFFTFRHSFAIYFFFVVKKVDKVILLSPPSKKEQVMFFFHSFLFSVKRTQNDYAFSAKKQQKVRWVRIFFDLLFNSFRKS